MHHHCPLTSVNPSVDHLLIVDKRDVAVLHYPRAWLARPRRAMAMSGVTQQRLQMLSAWTMMKKKQANLTYHTRLSKALQ